MVFNLATFLCVRNGVAKTPESLNSPMDTPMGPETITSPTLHQKIRAIGGVPTPFAVSASPGIRRSNPPTPTQATSVGGGVVNRTDYYIDDGYVATADQRLMSSSTELMYDRQQQQPQYHVAPGGAGVGAQMASGGPIRELASSPQNGVYLWKDNSPTRVANQNFNSTINSSYSNPTSPIQPTMMNCAQNNTMYSRGYGGHPSSEGSLIGFPGSPSFSAAPTSPNGRRKMYPGGVVGVGMGGQVVDGGVGVVGGVRPSPLNRRPMSFVRALEMTDSLEMSNNRGANNRSSPAGTPNRASVYDTNYEISV